MSFYTVEVVQRGCRLGGHDTVQRQMPFVHAGVTARRREVGLAEAVQQRDPLQERLLLDFVGTTPSTVGLEALGETPVEMLAPLAAMAELNARRTQDAFKAVAVAYISVPIALAALVSEAAPDVMRTTILTNLDGIAPIVAAFLLTPIVYFCGHWRAKQIAWIGAIELATCRRR